MDRYQDIFERYEKKYLLNEKSCRNIRKRLEGHMRADEYGESTIRSLYFDTPDRRLIRTSLEKPAYKEKLRLRGYGNPGAKDTVFVELKKKYKGVVYKRRVDMPLFRAEAYLTEQGGAPCPTQITSEIDWFLSFYPGIAPSMLIVCRRTALCGIEDPSLRVTFDQDIVWREEHLSLCGDVWGNPLLKKGGCLMEIKIPGVMPLWLSAILSDAGAFPVSFSKYGRAYLQSAADKNDRKGSVLCA